MLIKLAKLAPAPNATKSAGKAQQIRADDDANNESKFVVLSVNFASKCPAITASYIAKICAFGYMSEPAYRGFIQGGFPT